MTDNNDGREGVGKEELAARRYLEQQADIAEEKKDKEKKGRGNTQDDPEEEPDDNMRRGPPQDRGPKEKDDRGFSKRIGKPKPDNPNRGPNENANQRAHDLHEAKEVLTDDIRDLLMQYENVEGVGLGVRKKQGRLKASDGAHIIVHVDRKRPVHELEEEQVIPTEVHGIPTDVIVTGGVKEEMPRNSRFRPVVGGIGGGHPDTTSGTIGSPVIDTAEGQRVMLTNAHIADPNATGETVGDNFLQPGPMYGGSAPDDVIGTVYEVGKRDETASDNVDTALVAINSDIQSDYMWGAGQFAGFEDADFSTRYANFGNASGLTSGMLVEVDANMTAEASDGTLYEYTGVERYERFHESGDSGSLNVRVDRDTGDVYGVSVHFAGSAANEQSWAIPWSMIRAEHGELRAARD